MRVIILTQGQHTVVEDDVYEWSGQFNWRLIKTPRSLYAARSLPAHGETRRQKIVYLHREILQAPVGLWVDHIDCDGLNNLRENLRLCFRGNNAHNSRKSVVNSSGYKGVSFSSQLQRWKGSIRIAGRGVHLGYFDIAEDAARAYDMAALELHKEFARLNFPNT